MPLRFHLLLLHTLLLPAAFFAIHLPAVRRPGLPQLVDSKRVLASRLLRSADRHKDRSLRDVLGERRTASSPRPVFPASGKSGPHPSPTNPSPSRPVSSSKEEATVEVPTLSHLFAWAINNTVYTTVGSYSTTLFTSSDTDDPPVKSYTSAVGTVDVTAELHQEADLQMKRTEPKASHSGPHLPVRQALSPATLSKKPSDATGHPTKPHNRNTAEEDAADFELLNSSTESEFDVLRRNVHVLDTDGVRPGKTVHALQIVEELCHSIDNGRDLQVSGGIYPLLKALASRHDSVRATAAWALATCCQNNPPVQNASLTLGAVPRLARLAVLDGSGAVRSKALFALNALLELESARLAFEELPYAVKVVQKALLDSSDHRATRRALNLTELLVQKNLDAWKTQLEAWDIPLLIERIMRSHPNDDVRESAARTIAALDGRLVS